MIGTIDAQIEQPQDDATPVEVLEEATVPVPRQTMRDLVFGGDK